MISINKVILLTRWVLLLVFLVHTSSLFLHLGKAGETVIKPDVSGYITKLTMGPVIFDIRTSIPDAWIDAVKELEQAGFNTTVILGCVAIVPYLMLYLLLFRLFGLYQHQQVFTKAAIQQINYVAMTLLLWVVLVLFYPLIVTLLIETFFIDFTLKRFVGVTSTEVIRLLIGLVIYIMAWAMKETVVLKQENELAAQKEQMFANISHEFKTPLTLILTPLTSLIAKPTDTQQQKLSMMHRNGHRLLRMIDQMLELSRLQTKQSTPLHHYSLNETLSVLLTSFRPLIEHKKLTLDCEPFTDVIVTMQADALEMILTNLISNAIKYTPEQGEISVEVSSDQTNVILSIKDNGMGIKPQNQQTVFDRFTRANQSDESIPGAGIGLALVKELVDSHRGNITLTSEWGKGSTFTVTLPHSRDKSATAEMIKTLSSSSQSEIEALQSPQSVTTPTTTSQDDSPNKATLLLIDDNADMLALLVDILQQNFNCLSANNGEAGVHLAKEQLPDLIISDVMMPGISGYQVVRQIKQDELTCHIPVVLLTAKTDVQSRLKGWRDNADEYLEKPFNAIELMLRIENLLSIRGLLRHRYQREFTQPTTEVVAVGQPGSSEDNEAPIAQMHQTFMDNINQVLEQHFTQTDFTIGQLARELAMSERQLSRKMKSLLDLTPGETIRSYRLKKAAEGLARGVSPSVIAYEVGFASHSYFSQCFKAQYKCKPSDFTSS